MGLTESALKPFPFLSHCKISCDSPCCTKICGEDNHCNVNTDTHEYVNTDSDEEHIENNNTYYETFCRRYVIIIIISSFFASVV